MIKVGIIGANGYTGLELMKLICAHPKAELTMAVSRSNVGAKITDMYRNLNPALKGMEFCDLDINAIEKNCDVVFAALPHGASGEICGKLFDKGLKVIDLSADFRYNDIGLYESTYKVAHPRKDLIGKSAYGLCELNREKIKSSSLIGNPGCYTTTAILALTPLLKEGLISPKGIIIDAKSGTTGAGKKSDSDYNYCEVDENFKAYGVTTHRHTSEIEEKLSVNLSFAPHLLPVKRGILETIYTDASCSAADVTAAYEKFYGGEKFVSFYDEGILPELKWVVGSNSAAIGFKLDKRLNRLIIVACLDNLLKGASGQAVQNMNIICGLNEETGLTANGLYL